MHGYTKFRTTVVGDPVYRNAWTFIRHVQTRVAHRCGEAPWAAWCRAAVAAGVTGKWLKFKRMMHG